MANIESDIDEKPSVHTAQEKPDYYNWLEDRFERYVSSGDSLFGSEIHDLFHQTSTDLEALINERVIKELEAIPAHTSAILFEAHIQRRIAELRRGNE